jgi:serine protease Do
MNLMIAKRLVAVFGFCFVASWSFFATTHAAQDNRPAANLEKQIQTTIQKVLPACVGVTEARQGGVGSFSGIIVTPEGHILSAGHAVRSGNEYTVHLADGRRATAVGLGVNRWIDCALLKIKDRGDWPHVEMGQSADLVKGQAVFSVSHPGVFRADRGPVVRFGHVVLPQTIPLGMIQSTALMEPGDSGGPLLDLKGRVVGIRSQIRQSLSENYDVPVDSYRLYWDRLNEPNDFEVDSIPGLPDPGFTARRSRRGGSRVVTVKEDSVAAKADLQEDDIITRVNGKQGTAWNLIADEYLNGKREFELDVTRGEAREKLTLSFPVETKASVEPSTVLRASAALVDGFDWKQCFDSLEQIEEALDDYCITIQSKMHDEVQVIQGTILKPNGLVVSKNSSVGDSPQLKLRDGTLIDASVVSRDLSNDLVLLKPSQAIEGGIDLGAVPAEDHADELGSILISPNPEGEGCFSIVASGLFRAPKDAGRGYLGVELNASENGVTLGRVMPDSAAMKAGLKEGDIIKTVDGVEVKTVRDMQGYLRGTIPSDQIKVVFMRGEEELTESVKLGEVINNQPHVADAFDGGRSSRRDGFQSIFCHDGTLFPHECGGPLFDCDGKFIGLNIARYSRTQCYAIPSGIVKSFVESATK